MAKPTLTLTYHARSGAASVKGLQIPHLAQLAAALRNAAPTVGAEEVEAFLTELADGCDELVAHTGHLGHGNPVVTKQVPRVDRPGVPASSQFVYE